MLEHYRDNIYINGFKAQIVDNDVTIDDQMKSIKKPDEQLQDYKRSVLSIFDGVEKNNLDALMFNWKSIMAPANILDYIIVHEMCHLKYMNHSNEFWEMLGRVLTDYESRREWLMNNGIRLEL